MIGVNTFSLTNPLQIVGPGGQDLMTDVDGPILVYRT